MSGVCPSNGCCVLVCSPPPGPTVAAVFLPSAPTSARMHYCCPMCCPANALTPLSRHAARSRRPVGDVGRGCTRSTADRAPSASTGTVLSGCSCSPSSVAVGRSRRPPVVRKPPLAQKAARAASASAHSRLRCAYSAAVTEAGAARGAGDCSRLAAATASARRRGDSPDRYCSAAMVLRRVGRGAAVSWTGGSGGGKASDNCPAPPSRACCTCKATVGCENRPRPAACRVTTGPSATSLRGRYGSQPRGRGVGRGERR